MGHATLGERTRILGTGPMAMFLLLLCPLLSAQTYTGLLPLEHPGTKTYYSPGSEQQAREMAQRCDRVISFYGELLDFEPKVTLLVLSKEDWGAFTNFPVYGMPHYDDDETLIVASQDNEFWGSFIPPLENLPRELAQQVSGTYSDGEGNLGMRRFFDLLAIHELGHAYHMQAGLNTQRIWMGELFANVLLHTYTAEEEPELLPALTVFPKMVISSTPKESLAYTSLEELESNYAKIGQEYPNNYGWYQCRWHMAAANIYERGNSTALKNLWNALKTQKENLEKGPFITLLLEQVHQSVADVPLKWDRD